MGLGYLTRVTERNNVIHGPSTLATTPFLNGGFNPHYARTWWDAADVVAKWEPLEADCCSLEIWRKKSFFKCLTHCLNRIYKISYIGLRTGIVKRSVPSSFPFLGCKFRRSCLGVHYFWFNLIFCCVIKRKHHHNSSVLKTFRSFWLTVKSFRKRVSKYMYSIL